MTLPLSQPSYFDSFEVGAPTLNNVGGSLLEVIRAVGINGFNPKTVASIVVASGVATATAASHGYSATYGKLLLIGGCNEAALNGRKQPLSVTTNTFTFDATGVADGSYTGTMSVKRAPLGWTETHTGTNVAIFARAAPEALAWSLRVDDSGASPASAWAARVLIVGGVTGVDAYAAQSPIASVLGGAGGYWYKGADSATAKPWAIAGDGISFWLFTPYDAAGSRLACYLFGDASPMLSVDGNRTVLFASSQDYGGSFSEAELAYNNTPGFRTHVASVSAGSRSGATPGMGVLPRGIGDTNSGFGGSSNPAPQDEVPISAPVWLFDQVTPFDPRGTVPGMAQALANAPFGHLSVQIAGERRFLCVHTQASASNAQVLVDLTGPWQ